MIQRWGWLLFCLCVLPSSEGRAEPFDLGEIVVKDSRQTITQVAAVDELSQAQLQQRGAQTLADAIQSLPGVYTSIGRRNELTFNIRGFEQRQVPVLLDGIALMVPYDGYIDSGSLPLDSIAKITVTRGNSSVLYGGTAMGGVVNLITAKPERSLETTVAVGVAERGTAWGHVRVASRQQRYYLSADYGYSDSEDFRLSDDYTSQDNENGGVRQNSDRERENLALKIGFEPADGHEYAVGVQRVDSEWGMPAIDDGRARYWRFSQWQRTTYYLSGRSQLADAGQLHSRLFYDTFDNVLDSYDDDSLTSQTRRYAFHSTYDDHSYGGSLTFRPALSSRHEAGVALHYRRDVHRSQSDRFQPWLTNRSEQYAFSVEDNIAINEHLAVVVGLSYDLQRPLTPSGDFDRDSEDAWNPLMGLNWQVTPATRSWFSVAKKVRFPTLKELYSGLDDARVQANEKLKHERSVNYEVGLEQQFGDAAVVTMSLFYARIDDLIDNQPLGAGLEQLQNVGDARYVGGELSLRYRFSDGHEVNAHYTLLDATNRSAERSSDHLPYRSRHKAQLSVVWQLSEALNLLTEAQWNSRRYYQDSTTLLWQSSDDFWLCNAQFNLELFEQWQWHVGVRNLFDEDYQLEAGFPQPGRQLYAGLRYQF
ncbi:MAG: TonB-dependent receptor [Thermodesulfobacteriota bacterium]|nr:TonB-dependent receptor [Thermodesulfobacteriota bacterium]